MRPSRGTDVTHTGRVAAAHELGEGLAEIGKIARGRRAEGGVGVAMHQKRCSGVCESQRMKRWLICSSPAIPQAHACGTQCHNLTPKATIHKRVPRPDHPLLSHTWEGGAATPFRTHSRYQSKCSRKSPEPLDHIRVHDSQLARICKGGADGCVGVLLDAKTTNARH